MDAVTRALEWLLRISTRALPAGRRTWGEAVRAEAGDVPRGSARLWWVVGGLRMVARETHVARRIGLAAIIAAAAVGVVAYGWHAGSSNPAMPIHRFHVIATIVMLAGLPWVVRSHKVFGPVGASRAARVVRLIGYGAVCALLPTIIAVGNFAGARFGNCDGCSAADRAQWRSERMQDAVSGSAVTFVVMAGCALMILRLTSRRSSASAITLAIGGACGVAGAAAVYALTPFGGPLRITSPWLAGLYSIAIVLVVLGAPLLAGVQSAHRALRDDADVRVMQGVSAGLLTGVVAAVLLTVLTVPTMVLFPRDVHLEWANPDPTVPHGTTYEVQMSVGDGAQKYEFFLILGPLIGLGLGAAGGVFGSGPGRPRPDGPQEARLLAPTR